MKSEKRITAGCLWLGAALALHAGDTRITIDAARTGQRISPYLAGACIEDVNHEVYGGIDSQMIFGESFAEPAPAPEIRGFTRFGGSWIPENGELRAAVGDGPKLVSDDAAPDGETSVEVLFPDKQEGNAGLILRVASPRDGADAFTGYEVSLDTSGKLILGRHRQNWEPLRSDPCEVPVGRWIKLAVATKEAALEVRVDGKTVTCFEDKEHPLPPGRIGLRTWRRDARFRNLSLTASGKTTAFPLESTARQEEVSGPWRTIRSGNVEGGLSLDPDRPFSGNQSQHIRFVSGEGMIGIENQGLNRQGMNFVEGKPYQGKLWVRAAKGTGFFAALESRDGKTTYATQPLTTTSGDWQALDFTLTPKSADTRGRFSIRLEKPGAISIGYAFLQPGEWGRFKGLPVRKDVAEGLVAQGVTVMRYGGCMANAPEYRWKNMIGPREKRPPYKGWWYPQSSNGWGIFDFLNFCEAAGFLAIPDVNMDESPQDMADFIEYVNGPADSKWGAKRAADGHPAPYHLKHLQLGNEEKVNADYWRKFKPMAEAIWAKDKDIILVVGDFAYQKPVNDPSRVEGADSKITTLDAQREILQLARQHGREVWFDLHIWTEGPLPSSYIEGTLSYLETMEKLADGARFKVIVFELNANNHDQRRALANAIAIQRFERDCRVPVVISANALQVDGHNDNGWDQGLLFLNPEKTWLQPPGYVTRMISSHYQPVSLPVETEGGGRSLDICAKRSDDGKTLVVQIANPGDTEETATFQLRNFPLQQTAAEVEQLAGPLDAANTAAQPDAITPKRSTWNHGGGTQSCSFPPHSFTVMTFR